jgi:hypothetical protein
MAPDRTILSRIVFLEELRQVVEHPTLNVDSLAAREHLRLVRDGFPIGVSLQMDESPARPNSDRRWIESGEFEVSVVVRAVRDTTLPRTVSQPAWSDTFTTLAPVDSEFLVSLRGLSEAMAPFFGEQRYMKNNQRIIEWNRWGDYWKVKLRPLSASALACIDSLRPVMVEVADMQMQDARRYLYRALADEEQHSRVGLLGLSVSTPVAMYVVPALFLGACLLLALLVARTRELASQAQTAMALAAWPPLFAKMPGACAAFGLFLFVPLASVLLFAARTIKIDHGWVGVTATLLGALACLWCFAVLPRVRQLLDIKSVERSSAMFE